MLTRMVQAVSLGLLVVGMVAPVFGNPIDEFFRSLVRDTQRRQCWPQPFNCQDRQLTRAPFAIIVANGWERQNVCGDAHFEPNSGQLTPAGRLKIGWILTEAPQQHRIVYVRRTLSEEETAARMQAVQEYLARFGVLGESVLVLESTMPDHGWPAERVDRIGRKFLQATPEPKLPAVQNQTTGQ